MEINRLDYENCAKLGVRKNVKKRTTTMAIVNTGFGANPKSRALNQVHQIF